MYASHSESRPLLILLLLLAGGLGTACASDSVCDDGACDPGTDMEGGAEPLPTEVMETAVVTETEYTPPHVETELPTDVTPTDADVAMTELPSIDAGDTDSGASTDASVETDAMAPIDGGGGDAGDGGPREASTADTDPDPDPDPNPPCDGCCDPVNEHRDCDQPTPVCDRLSSRCVECFDVDDLGCTGNTPRCKAGVTVGDNACVQCLSAEDCGSENAPACQENMCVTCSVADDFGCPMQAPRCLAGDVPQNNTCVECFDSGDCGENAPACQQNLCVACSAGDNFGCPSETPWCLAGDEPQSNTCVECLDNQDCPNGTPICENNQCIPCSLDDDAGCAQQSAPRCLEGVVPDENTCVQCLDFEDCNNETPFCVDNGCVECTQASHCETTELPVCDGSGTCTGCGGNPDCARFPSLPICDTSTGICEQCTTNTHCTSPNASVCDLGTLSCSQCDDNDDCAHISGRNVCDDGLCVACTVEDESACGGNSCNPATRSCTGTAIGSRRQCDSCLADSECIGGGIGNAATFRCVPMTFQGDPRPGGYCLPRAQGGCDQPFGSVYSTASLSGTTSESYCSINQNGGLNPANAVTCEAVRDLLDNATCSADEDCGDGEGGRCATVGGNPNRCTYVCGSTASCPSDRTCADSTTDLCE